MAMEHSPLRTYGRVKARTLKPRQAGLVETLLPHLAIDIPEGGRLDPLALWTSPEETVSMKPPAAPAPAPPDGVFLEIGFGGGEHLVAQAQRRPDALFLGAEPFLNGVASCLRHIEESGVQNVRLHQGDARALMAALPDGAVREISILFPDPWPKKRHWKRRLIQPDFVAELARILEPGGEVRFATDWAHYAAWTLECFQREARFAWTAERAADWRAPWEGHVTTRYEQKRLGDCAPVFLRFVRA